MIGDFIFMETAIYIRVSTEEQAQEGFSIRGQEEKLKDYARIKEWSIYNIYIDEGISGKNIIERPAVNKMINDIENGKVKNVLVFKIDRLTRNTGDLVYLIDLFSKYNCAFNSLMESIDTQTPSGRMFIKIIGIFAEFERENIAERTRLGYERKAKEGNNNSAYFVSYGYDRPKGQKIQTINEEESKIVKEIFHMYVEENKSLLNIAKTMNKRGIPTKEQGTWHANTVRSTLTNCNYIGKVRYAILDEKRGFETKGKHEAIIDNEVFEKAQQRIAKNKKFERTKKPRNENYFLGFLHCPSCGKKLLTHGTYKKDENGEEKYIGAYKCNNKNLGLCDIHMAVRHYKIEEAFFKYIENIDSFEEFNDIQEKKQEYEKKRNIEILESYNKKLSKLKTKEIETLNLYIDGKAEFEEYRIIKAKIETDKKDIQEEIEKLGILLEEEKTTINKEDIILELKENWGKLTNKEKRNFLIEFVKKIDITIKKAPNNFHWLVTVDNVEFI